MHRSSTRAALAAPAAAAALCLCLCLGLGGCGLGPGPGTGDVSLLVTRDFGTRGVGSLTASRVPGSETVMRMLERHFRIRTRYGGGFVESIDGRSGTSAGTDWFFYVNGIEAAQGAATTAVHRGDHIWWDLHDWRATDSIPAVVGSFPEPFVNGSGGRRYPTILDCGTGLAGACAEVTAELDRLHVPVAEGLLGTGSGTDSIAVVVGTWGQIQGEVAAALLAHGPSSSGVYARFTGAAGAAELQLLDPAGRPAQTLGAGAGLIAATAEGGSAPTWLVTGTDDAGVRAAAAAFSATALHAHFALAVDGRRQIPVPLDPAR